ncbi:MAG: acyl-CoA synthetase FdrA [bacterium]
MSGHLGNRVRPGFYLDSVALMRVAREMEALAGVHTAALMIGTPANKEILAAAGLLTAEGRRATPRDLIVGARAASPEALQNALAQADARLSRPRGGGGNIAGGKGDGGAGDGWRPRMLRSAVEALPGANLALVSLPGEFAAEEARKALRAGLHVLLFSANVSVEDEIALKSEAQARGLLVMGPDCGTALIGGVPLAFANVVPRGGVGIVSASGTGLQEVSSLIARLGGGVSHGIGTGSRDLSEAVGAATTLRAIEALDADPATRHIVLLSKPPAAAVAARVLQRVAASAKPFTICLLGLEPPGLPPNARAAATLQQAAEMAAEATLPEEDGDNPSAGGRPPGRPGWLRGLFAGGTLCAEAQVIARSAGLAAASNAPIPGVEPVTDDRAAGHTLLDLGAEQYTIGRPHPMIDPAPRDAMLRTALQDPQVAVVLLDVVLGFGAHQNPAQGPARAVAEAGRDRPAVVASVCGTDDDPQGRRRQVDALRKAGVLVAASNAAAARLALSLLPGGSP